MILIGDGPVARRLAEVGQEFGHGLALDLGRMRAVLSALGSPEQRLPPVIHVAGTNGKGSTCAFLRAIVEAAGRKAHVFTSPHLIAPNERVRIAGALAADDALIAAIDAVAATGLTVTYFEAVTAAAFVLFAQTRADALILEVGLGGRFDATNVIERPAAAVIAPVALDHTAILGGTLAQIAAEKAGILKRGAPAVLARQAPESLEVIERIAQERGARLWRCGVEWDCWRANGRLAVQLEDRFLDLPAPSLFGPHQFENAGLAAAAVLAADFDLDEEAIGRGVASAVWPARMQRLRRGALVEQCEAQGAELWLDGGHNPHGATAVAEALDELQARAPRDVVLVCGALSTKDLEGLLRPLAQRARAVVATPFASKTARPTAEIAAAAAHLGLPATQAGSLTEAITLALSLAKSPRVLICGSLYLAGEVLALTDGVT